MNVILQSIALVAVAAVAGCDSGGPTPDAPLGDDTSRPTIRIASAAPAIAAGEVCDAPAAALLVVDAGAEIRLAVDFADDRALSQYKVDVHNNFDCHTHGGDRPAGATRSGAAFWQVFRVETLAGRQQRVEERLQVPADATVGNYHLMFQALDAAGNEAAFVEVDVRVRSATDGTPPVVTLASPTADTTLARTAALRFRGAVADNLPLGGGRLDVTYTAPDGTAYTAGQVFFGTGTSAPFDIPFTLPPFLGPGLYRFRLEAFDAVGNVGTREVGVRYE